MLPEDCPKQLLSTEASVFDLLARLDITKSTGCDGIFARMLKQTADGTAPIISKLINQSISKGKFPREWKTARVVPVPKPGSEKDTAAGYRCISIFTCTYCIKSHQATCEGSLTGTPRKSCSHFITTVGFYGRSFHNVHSYLSS